ncbi:putative oligoribonuclease [Haematobia irritans]|uniref:putative oligoribonuclease n=1 Tax=Haematobia irritans TaxID=7368 RepID=UPI003F4F45B8
MFKNSFIFNPLYKLICRNIKTKASIYSIQDSQKMKSTDIVWMDLEMTGLDVFNDKIIEIACLITDKDMNIIAEGPCLAINHPIEVFETMNDWCKKHHNQSGLVERCLQSKITTIKAEELIIDFFKHNIPRGKCSLAGNSVYMDRLFLRKEMPAIDNYMHYRIIDVSTIKELARRWNPEVLAGAPVKELKHRSLEDIRESIEELRYYRRAFFK